MHLKYLNSETGSNRISFTQTSHSNLSSPPNAVTLFLPFRLSDLFSYTPKKNVPPLQCNLHSLLPIPIFPFSSLHPYIYLLFPNLLPPLRGWHASSESDQHALLLILLYQYVCIKIPCSHVFLLGFELEEREASSICLMGNIPCTFLF